MAGERHPPAPSPAPSWWRRAEVAVLTSVFVPFALLLAAFGYLMLHPFFSADPREDAATLFWTFSTACLVVPFAAASGPTRRIRIVIAVVVGVAWFAIGRFALA